MNIDLIPFSYFNIDETYQFGKFIRDSLTASHSEHADAQELINDLTDPLEKAELAIGSSTKSKETEEIQSEDVIFNDTFRGLVKVITGFALSPIAAQRTAANLLMPILEKNDKTLYKAGYNEQASRFTSLTRDLSTAGATQALNTLGLTEWMDFQTAQLGKVEDLRKDRIDNTAVTQIPTDKDAKDKLQEVIEFVLSDINTLIRRNKVPGLAETDKKIEAKAKELAAIARARKTRNANSITDEEDLAAE